MIDCGCLSEWDLQTLGWLLKLSPAVEYIALPFVESSNDVIDVANIIEQNESPTGTMPKLCPVINKQQAAEELSLIAPHAGAIMVGLLALSS